MSGNDGERLLTPSDVAASCQVSAKTVLRAIRAGRLRAYRLGARGSYRIRPSDVDAWLDDQEVQPVVAPLRAVTPVPGPSPAAPVGGRLRVPRSMGR
jgi:excisionase family DNA binding protein